MNKQNNIPKIQSHIHKNRLTPATPLYKYAIEDFYQIFPLLSPTYGETMNIFDYHLISTSSILENVDRITGLLNTVEYVKHYINDFNCYNKNDLQKIYYTDGIFVG